jgi:hypothetical protein
MQFKIPKNDEKYHWTNHVIQKMTYYGLSPDRVKRVIRAPKRAEVGIAEGTLAVMQPAGSKKNPQEIWVMYAERGGDKPKKNILETRKKIIVTAWRYPGISRIREQVPIPADILSELKDLDLNANL